MPHQILVTETTSDGQTIERYRQTVDELNLRALVELVNPKPKRIRSDKGKTRTEAK